MFITTRGLFPSREDISGVQDWLQKSEILSPPVLSMVKTMRLTVKADSWSLPEQRPEKPTKRHRSKDGYNKPFAVHKNSPEAWYYR
jgi:hypothetical protein